MKNFLGLAETMTYTAPAAGVTTGVPVLIGALFVVPYDTVGAGVQFSGVVEGAFTLTKLAGEGDLVEGEALYWDVANARVTIDPTAGLPIGTVGTGGALTAAVTCPVRLHGVSLAGRIHTIRKRFLIAALNAGATLLPDQAGIAIRMVDSLAIAIGGAVTTVTTVDVKGTQAAAGVKLVAYGQAALTQSAVVRVGAAGGVVLADGASFAQCDRGKGITVGVTGANISVATAVDFEFSYTVE